MQANVGSVDKGIRIVIGVALLAYAFLGHGQSRWFGLIGILPIVTALVSFCPLYSLIGIKTCATNAKP